MPIPKSRDLHSYSAISLTSCIDKTAERMVLNRLLWWMEPFRHNMDGFIKGVAPTDYGAVLLGLITCQPAIAVFLSLALAFELARVSAIIASLSAEEVQGRFLIWVANYLTDKVARVCFQGHLSSYHRMKYGTPQVDVLSPTLFNVFMENLAVLNIGEDVCLLYGRSRVGGHWRRLPPSQGSEGTKSPLLGM
ncbi:uncharacterized protein LOC143034486 [Oratosquilla oratoria]|uniref:uncharacterized protein LOC143034486 n=1 Tax=Oratosquilla oratoria TaxID=337810 RepID=UPI003F777159